jgi:hypothetical protein
LKLNLDLITKHFSNTSTYKLIRYFENPIVYYQNIIENSKQIDEDRKAIFNREVGTQVHAFIEKMYLPYLGKIINYQDIEALISQIEDYVFEAEFIKNNRFFLGSNDEAVRAALELISCKINSILTLDRDELKHNGKVTIVNIDHLVKVDFITNGGLFNLRSYSHRLDRQDETIRLIHYSLFNPINRDIFNYNEFNDSREFVLHPSFRYLFSAWAYWRKNNMSNSAIDFSIYNAGNKETIGQVLKLNIDSKQLVTFEKRLTTVFQDILSIKYFG